MTEQTFSEQVDELAKRVAEWRAEAEAHKQRMQQLIEECYAKHPLL